MLFTYLERALWLCGILLQIGILWQMRRRGLHHNFRFFFLYIGFILVKDLLLTGIYVFAHPAYVAAYWFGEAAAIALSLMVLEEVMRNALRPFENLRRIGMGIFAVAVLVAMGAAVASALAPGRDSNALAVAILVMLRGVRVLQVVLLLSLIALSSVLRISWLDLGFGIMVGFGVFVSLELAVVAVRAYAGESAEALLRIMAPASFLGAQLVWAYYATRSVPVVTPAAVTVAGNESWNQAMQEFLQR
jgi:hypothetical protein